MRACRVVQLLPITALLIFLPACEMPSERQAEPSRQTVKPAQSPLNVLMIGVDDLNDWVGVMGGHPQTQTPHIDRLAAGGMLFANAHANAPICGPSRTSLMTGLRPSTTGVYSHIEDNDIRRAHPATRDLELLPEYFSRRGYKTMAVGKVFHKGAPDGAFAEFGGREPGFGPKMEQPAVWDRKGTSTDWAAFPERDEQMPDYRSARWAIERLQQRHDRPFFLAVGFLRPHVPWYVPQPWFDLHPPEQLLMPPYLPNDSEDTPAISKAVHEVNMMPTAEWARQTGEWPNIVQAYLASVSFVDHYIGQVLKALEVSPYRHNTLVVLWSDHGYHIGEKNRFAKNSLWEESTRIPLIIKAPGVTANQVSQAPVSLLDLYPTLLDMAGLPAYDRNEGNSLKPLLQAGTTDWPHAAVTTYGPGNHAIRDRRYRYIRYEDGSEELYDHDNDPNEWKNLADNPDFDVVKTKLKRHLPVVNEPMSPLIHWQNIKYFRDKAREAGIDSE